MWEIRHLEKLKRKEITITQKWKKTETEKKTVKQSGCLYFFPAALWSFSFTRVCWGSCHRFYVAYYLHIMSKPSTEYGMHKNKIFMLHKKSMRIRNGSSLGLCTTDERLFSKTFLYVFVLSSLSHRVLLMYEYVGRCGTCSSEVATWSCWWAHSVSTPGSCTMTFTASRLTLSAPAGPPLWLDTTGVFIT